MIARRAIVSQMGAGMRIAVFALAFSTMLALSGAASAAEPIRLRADAWCPYNCAPDAEKPGYMVEIARLLFADSGVDYQLMPWTRAVEEAREGKVDAVAGATAEDAAGLAFGKQALGASQNVIITRRGDPWRYAGPASLAGRKLAAVRDYAYSDELDAYIKAHEKDGGRLELVSGDDVTDQNLKKLLAGRVDAVVEDRNVVEFALVAQGMEGLVEQQPVGPAEPLYLAFAPGPAGAERAAKLDAGIQTLRQSGELRRILARYGLSDWQTK